MISHKHKCIFVHIPKAAGKSIKQALFGIPEFGPHLQSHSTETVPAYIENAYGHQSVAEYRAYPQFKQYFKFCVVRNPFDRLVSAFTYLSHGGCNPRDEVFQQTHLQQYEGNFEAFVTEAFPAVTQHEHFRSQTSWIRSGWKKRNVDYIGRFEALPQSLEQVAQRLDITGYQLPYLNKSTHRPYQEYYTDKTIDIVRKAYASDLQAFRYTF